MNQAKEVFFLKIIRMMTKEKKNSQQIVFTTNLSYDEVSRIIEEGPKESELLEYKFKVNKNNVGTLKIEGKNLILLYKKMTTGKTISGIYELFITNIEEIFFQNCLGSVKSIEIRFSFGKPDKKIGVCEILIY